MNPYGKVPVLVDDGAVIYESAIINEYLEEKYPEPRLLPEDPALRARARIWIDFCNTRVHGATHEIRYGRDAERARAELDGHWKTLNEALRGREYLVGAYSLADITFIPVFTRQDRYGFKLDASLSNLRAWLERVLARPAVQATLRP